MSTTNLHGATFLNYAGCSILHPVVTKRIYLREWRQHKGMTQAQVVASLQSFDDPNLPVTEASLSRIETGKQPYSQRVLEALAEIYGREPWELIGRHPDKDGEVIDLLDRLNDQQRRQAKAVIEALAQSA